MEVLNANSILLRKYLYLAGGTLRIPYSQRPYEWGKPQATRLFEDFVSVHEAPDTKHVLNFITVYQENENSRYIYDGQQRTVSSLLLVSALLRILKEIGEEDSAKNFIDKYLVSKDEFDETINTYKLIFDNRDANDIFKRYICKGLPIPSSIETTDYNKHLQKNYQLYYDLVKEKWGDTPSASAIKEFLKNFLNNVVLILIETPEEEIASKMFNTLNSTGQQLADFYILKNYLSEVLGEHEVKEYWERIEANTDGLNKNKFLVNYASAFNGKTPNSNIFNRVKSLKELENREKTLEFAIELEDASKSFASMDAPHIRLSESENEKREFIEHIKTLKLLNAIQYKPVIIAMDLKKFTLNNINSVLESIIKLQIRNIYIGELPSNTIENFYPNLATSIYKESIIDTEEIKQEINSQLISNSVLNEKFNTKLVRSRQDKVIAKYILRTIYNIDHTRKNQNETLINEDTQIITLEHILPEKPDDSSDWVSLFSEEEREKFTFLFGNLTLLLRNSNSTGNNFEFNIKKNEFIQSVIQENRRIAENNIWDKKAILERTGDLFEKFNSIWNKE